MKRFTDEQRSVAIDLVTQAIDLVNSSEGMQEALARAGALTGLVAFFDLCDPGLAAMVRALTKSIEGGGESN